MVASSLDRERTPTLAIIMLALTPFSLGYFFSYLYRAVNAVVAPDLTRELGLSASELGLLTAAYLATFALFQIPLGVLLDRYGPRRVQAALVAIGGIGAILFALGQNAWMLTLARAIIGIGFAGGLMASFKAVVLWVPEPRRALGNACVMSGGAIGLLVSTTPMALITQSYGWRMTFFGLAGVTFLVAAIIFLVVPRYRGEDPHPGSVKTQLREVGSIYRDRVFLALAPLLASTAGIHIALQTLWAAPWLRDVGGLDRTEVANHLFVMALAFFIGILFSGAVADWLVRRGMSLLTVMLSFVGLFLASQVGILIAPDSEFLRLTFWSIFGMTGQSAILAYPWISSYFGAALSGRSNTAMNLLLFMTAFLAQYAVGWLIDLFPQRPGGGYDPESYRVSFGIMLALQLLALIWYLANLGRLRRAEPSRRDR